MTISVVGRCPPPIGGVSIYVSRRFAMLESFGEDVDLINFSDKKWLLQLLRSKSEIYEINTFNLYILGILFLTGKIKKSIFVDHNASRLYSGVKKKILLWLLKYSKQIWVVKEDLIKFYPSNFNIKVVSPFLPPDEKQYNEILNTYPESVSNFIKEGLFVVNSAWKYIPYENSDLYGIQTSIDLLKEMPDLSLLLAIAEYNPGAMPIDLVNDINQYADNGRLCLLTCQKQLWPVFKHKAIFLRLTSEDGDSVSVKEALHFEIPVVASDVVSRPNDCITYKYDDFNDLCCKLSELLV